MFNFSLQLCFFFSLFLRIRCQTCSNVNMCHMFVFFLLFFILVSYKLLSLFLSPPKQFPSVNLFRFSRFFFSFHPPVVSFSRSAHFTHFPSHAACARIITCHVRSSNCRCHQQQLTPTPTRWEQEIVFEKITSQSTDHYLFARSVINRLKVK